MAAQRSRAVTSLTAAASTLPHCSSFSTFCVCLQCYLNARWELMIGVPRITHSSLGFVVALAWAFAHFTHPSWLGCDPSLAKSLWPTRAQWLKHTKGWRLLSIPPQDRLDLRNNGSAGFNPKLGWRGSQPAIDWMLKLFALICIN